MSPSCCCCCRCCCCCCVHTHRISVYLSTPLKNRFVCCRKPLSLSRMEGGRNCIFRTTKASSAPPILPLFRKGKKITVTEPKSQELLEKVPPKLSPIICPFIPSPYSHQDEWKRAISLSFLLLCRQRKTVVLLLLSAMHTQCLRALFWRFVGQVNIPFSLQDISLSTLCCFF